MDKVSLYIPCYNAEKHIERCLRGVFQQTYSVDEVLLIDDGSRDATTAIAACFPVQIIRHAVNQGLAAGRNTAVRAARNEFIASLDSDCVAHPDWLANLMRNFTDETIAGVGGWLMETHCARAIDRWRSVYMKQNWGKERLVNPRFLFGSNTVFRKQALLKVGLYNEQLRTNYEDCDLSLKLRAKGYTLIYDSQAAADHLRSDSLRSLLDTYWRWTLTGTGGRRTPDTLYNLGCKCYDHTVYAVRMLGDDIGAGRVDFLPLDVVMLAHNIARDTGYYINKIMIKSQLPNPNIQ